MKREIYYIAFDPDFKILFTSKWYNEEMHNFVCLSRESSIKKEGINYINVTHPNSKEKLAKINKVNSTNYK